MESGTVYEPADIVIHVRDKGIVLREKSLVAFRRDDGKIEAFGTEAEGMIGKDPENIVVISPLRQGMIADFMVAEKLFSMLLIKALGKRPLLKPAVAVCVPKGITEVEKKAMDDALILGGAKEILFADTSAEEFMDAFLGKSPDLYHKYKIIIDITKNEPERYIEERLRDVLAYAEQEQIPPERVGALLRELRGQ